MSVVYDQDTDPQAVIDAARCGFAFAVQAIRDNDLRASDGLLDSMQQTFDDLHAIASTLVGCIVEPS